ncbi:MAG: glycosyltransferase [Planctomycetes bacterium]|nr:glycosyltransferase [Planctomycetota bacterium]
MKVGIDYWPASTHGPGVGRYVRETVRALARLEDAPRLALLDVGRGQRAFEEDLGLDGRGVLRVRASLPRRALQWSARLGLGADRWLGGCDVFHGALHDAPPLSRALRTLALAEFPRADAQLDTCAAIVTFSAWAATQLTRRFELDPARVHVLPVGCDHWSRDAAPRARPDGAPWVLALGRLDSRRAPSTLLAACELLRAGGRELRLAFLGRRGDAYDELRARVTRSPMCTAVRFVSEPSERELASNVASASVLVHLTDGELSAVTPLEGLAAGAGVVASRIPTFEELLGAHATFVEGPPGELEPAVLAAALQRALDAPPAPRTFLEHFTWERHARALLELWRSLPPAR